jgi:hypothetical protein
MSAIRCVTLDALIRRLNRKLMKDEQSVHKTRSQDHWKHQDIHNGKGDYFLADNRLGKVLTPLMTAPELEAFAREKGALKSWEVMRG